MCKGIIARSKTFELLKSFNPDGICCPFPVPHATAGRALFLGEPNFPKIRACRLCADFGQQCGRGIVESSPKLRQTFTGQFWGDGIQRAQPTSALTHRCVTACRSLLGQCRPAELTLQPHSGGGVPQGMNSLQG